jgi:hypothetical protein
MLCAVLSIIESACFSIFIALFLFSPLRCALSRISAHPQAPCDPKI